MTLSSVIPPPKPRQPHRTPDQRGRSRLPVCVHDDREQATARAQQIFAGYGNLPNYRQQLDAEGLGQAGDMAVVGNEDQVSDTLGAYFDAGATEVIASVYPSGVTAGDHSREPTHCSEGW